MGARFPKGESASMDGAGEPSERSAGPQTAMDSMAKRTVPLFDMHCHLDFLENAAELAHEGAQDGAAFFSNTVRPADYEDSCGRLAGEPNVRVGLGAHPWWIGGGSIGAEEFESMLACIDGACFIGEVGLDFGRVHGQRIDAQLQAFRAIARCCAAQGGKVLSIHAVRSAGAVLDILEETGALESCACIFHWFSGTSEELTRARRAGCCFSVNRRMLETKRGRAYVQAIEGNRLLLETDLPACAAARLGYDAYREDIRRAASLLADARQGRGTDASELLQRIAQTSRALLGYPPGSSSRRAEQGE